MKKFGIQAGARRGSYQGMTKRRAYLISVHAAFRPTVVTRNGRALGEHASRQALVQNTGISGWAYDEQSRVIWIKASTGWRYGADRPGPKNDPEQDTAYWADGAEGQTAENLMVC